MLFALVQIAIVLTVVGLLYWLIVTYLPVPQPIKMVLTIIMVLITCVFLLHFVGVLDLDHSRAWRW